MENQFQPSQEQSFINKKNERQVIELEALFEISQSLNLSLKLEEILNHIMFTSMGRLLISRAAIFLIEPTQIIISAQKGTKLSLQNSYHSDLQFTTQIELTADTHDRFLNELKLNKLHLLIPIIIKNKTIALFVIGEKLSKEAYFSAEINFLNALCGIAASSIQNSLNFLAAERANLNLDKRVQQLESLMEIGTRFNETLDFDEITKVLSRTLMGQFMISKYAIIYKISGNFKIVLQKSLIISEQDLILLEEDCMTELIPEKLNHIPLALKIPLIKQNECSGFLLLGKKMMGNNYSDDEISFLKNIASSASSALSNAVLFKETLEKEKLEEELRLAKKIQQELLPKLNPTFKNYQIIGSNQASKQVGGDYYDFIDLEELGTGIAIGDVSGKGASAALLMSNLQATMLALSSDKHKSITEQISKANSIIYRNTSPEKYITFFYGIMNDDTLKFTFVNAGHNFPLLYRKNSFTELKTGGIILGMMDHMPYDSETVQLENGDILVMYTDGITEAQDSLEEEYGEVNLKNIIAKNSELNVEEIHTAIINDVFKFSPNANDFDDITLIVLKIF